MESRFFLPIASLCLVIVFGGCTIPVNSDTEDDVCSAALTNYSFFPIEQGKSWRYVYSDGSSGAFNSSTPVGRHEGKVHWTVTEFSCSGTTAQFKIEEAFQGARHTLRWWDTQQWEERDTSWTRILTGQLRESVLEIEGYTSGLPEIIWFQPSHSEDTLRIAGTSNTLMGGWDYAGIVLVRKHGVYEASAGRQGRGVWWRRIAFDPAHETTLANGS
jgi:hypothetical protein